MLYSKKLGVRGMPGYDEEELEAGEPLACDKGERRNDRSPIQCLEVEQRCLGFPCLVK